MSTIQDTDLLLVNRGGKDYKVSAEDLHEYLNPKPPWEEEEEKPIYHVIIDDPADIQVEAAEKIYNLATQAEVSSIDAPGEYILIGKWTRFEYSLGNWQFGPLTDTSKATDMDSMFKDTKAFNSDISNWDVSNVKDMDTMFWEAKAFNQDLSQWCVSEVETYYRFDRGADAWEDKNKPVWGTCPRGEDGKREGLRIKRKRTK